VPDVRGARGSGRIDDSASPPADSPLEPPEVNDVVKTARQ
jgi:hypothetical protein